MSTKVTLGRRGETHRAAHAGPAKAAVSVRIFRQVLLVVVLGVVERGRGQHFRRDRAEACSRQPLLIGRARSFRSLALSLVDVIEARSILRPDVIPLAHAL